MRFWRILERNEVCMEGVGFVAGWEFCSSFTRVIWSGEIDLGFVNGVLPRPLCWRTFLDR